MKQNVDEDKNSVLECENFEQHLGVPGLCNANGIRSALLPLQLLWAINRKFPFG
jgi:hypothetical protein